MHRGFDFTEPRLYVWMAAKRCTPAVKKYAGGRPDQRHQMHKRRNVLDHTIGQRSPTMLSKGPAEGTSIFLRPALFTGSTHLGLSSLLKKGDAIPSSAGESAYSRGSIRFSTFRTAGKALAVSRELPQTLPRVKAALRIPAPFPFFHGTDKSDPDSDRRARTRQSVSASKSTRHL